VPQDLAKILRRAISNLNQAKLTCVDGDEPARRDAQLEKSQASNKRGARSKSRSKKPPSNDNKRVDKTAKALGIEINSTLDRISELDAQNELLMLEN
jgi:methionine synthase II (cobalamin-independent)